MTTTHRVSWYISSQDGKHGSCCADVQDDWRGFGQIRTLLVCGLFPKKNWIMWIWQSYVNRWQSCLTCFGVVVSLRTMGKVQLSTTMSARSSKPKVSNVTISTMITVVQERVILILEQLRTLWHWFTHSYNLLWELNWAKKHQGTIPERHDVGWISVSEDWYIRSWWLIVYVLQFLVFVSSIRWRHRIPSV